MRLPLFAAAAMLSASLAAHADTVYTYTGQDFIATNGAYTRSDSVTGSFTVATPLGDNLSNYSFTPESFSFNDGLQTLNSSDSNGYFTNFSTDASGDITGYRVISISDSSEGNSVQLADFYGGRGDQVSDQTDDGSLAFNFSAGSFTEQTAAVTPEPSSIALLGTGMLGIAGVVRKRLA